MVQESRVNHLRAVYRWIAIQFWSQTMTRSHGQLFLYKDLSTVSILALLCEIVSVKNGYDWDIPFFLTENT